MDGAELISCVELPEWEMSGVHLNMGYFFHFVLLVVPVVTCKTYMSHALRGVYRTACLPAASITNKNNPTPGGPGVVQGKGTPLLEQQHLPLP